MSERHEEYMKRRMKSEKMGVAIEYNTMRITEELEEIRDDIRKLQVDISYMMKKYE